MSPWWWFVENYKRYPSCWSFKWCPAGRSPLKDCISQVVREKWDLAVKEQKKSCKCLQEFEPFIWYLLFWDHVNFSVTLTMVVKQKRFILIENSISHIITCIYFFTLQSISWKLHFSTRSESFKGIIRKVMEINGSIALLHLIHPTWQISSRQIKLNLQGPFSSCKNMNKT